MPAGNSLWDDSGMDENSILQWMAEQQSCAVRILLISREQQKIREEEESLRRFQREAGYLRADLLGTCGAAVQAAGELQGLHETCQPAGIFGTAAGEQLQYVGSSLTAEMMSDLDRRIEQELREYRRKTSENEREISRLQSRKELLAEWIRQGGEEI